MLSAGFVDADVLAWREGLADWQPLGSLVSSPTRIIPPPRKRSTGGHSKMSIISFGYSLFGFVAWFILLLIAGVANNMGYSTGSVTVIVGLFVIAGMMLNIVASVLGFIGIAQAPGRLYAILGIVLNILQVIGIIGLSILGNLMKSQGQ